MPEINPLSNEQIFLKKIAENTGSNYNTGDVSEINPLTIDQILLKEIAANTAGQSGDITELEGKVADNTAAIEAITDVYGAKNLVPNNASTTEMSPVTFTVNSDKSVSVSRTGNHSSWRTLVLSENITLKAGTYILSSGYTGDEQYNVYLELVDSSRSVAKTEFSNEVTFTIQTDITNGKFQIPVRPGNSVFSDVTIKPMIRDARITDPTYVPYAMTNAELTDAVTKHSIINRANFINAIGETVLSNALPSRDAVIHAFLVVYGGYYPSNDSGAWIVVQSPIDAQDFVLELAERHVDMAYAPSTNIMTFNQTSGNADTVEIVIFRLY